MIIYYHVLKQTIWLQLRNTILSGPRNPIFISAYQPKFIVTWEMQSHVDTSIKYGRIIQMPPAIREIFMSSCICVWNLETNWWTNLVSSSSQISKKLANYSCLMSCLLQCTKNQLDWSSTLLRNNLQSFSAKFSIDWLLSIDFYDIIRHYSYLV